MYRDRTESGRLSRGPLTRREKRAEQQRKAAERDRLAKEAIARDDEATAQTAVVDRQVATLQGLLRASLSRDPRISLAALRRRAETHLGHRISKAAL